MTPEQQAVVDRIMELAGRWLIAVQRFPNEAAEMKAHAALVTAIEELAQQAAEARELADSEGTRAVQCLRRAWKAEAGLRDILRRDELAKHVATLGVDCEQNKLMELYSLRSAEEIARTALAAAEAVKGAALASQPLVPAGWVPLRIEWEPGYPEDVAFGPQRMMDRLKKWLDKHFARVVAERNAADGWEAPDFRKAWQGGLTNEELEQWWRLKLPHVEATNRDICVFALGVEVGAGMGEAPKPDTSLAASPAVQEAPPSLTQEWCMKMAKLEDGAECAVGPQEAPAAEHAADALGVPAQAPSVSTLQASPSASIPDAPCAGHRDI